MCFVSSHFQKLQNLFEWNLPTFAKLQGELRHQLYSQDCMLIICQQLSTLKSSFKKKIPETTKLSKAVGHFRDVPNCTRIKWCSPQYQLRLADGDRTHASRRTSLMLLSQRLDNSSPLNKYWSIIVGRNVFIFWSWFWNSVITGVTDKWTKEAFELDLLTVGFTSQVTRTTSNTTRKEDHQVTI